MISAPLPENELARIEKLNAFQILDSLPELDYDDLTKIAAYICKTPIALISLVDEDRQWFKSRVGLEATETPRDVAFCAHAILQPEELFEVPNAREDERFKDNPLVTGQPEVVFYVGAPLVTKTGEALGTLCVIDNKPREVDEEIRDTLRRLSRQVMNLLELRKSIGQQEEANDLLKKEITLRKNRETELVAARDQAMAAEQAKDQFLSNMSHEIRTPLNGLIGLTNLLLQDEGLPNQVKEMMQHIDFSSKHLLRIINDILDFNKLNTSKLSFEHIPFSFNDLLSNLYKNIHIKAVEKNIRLHINCDIAMPRQVLGDPHRIQQILFNLVGNAIKFTQKGSVEVAIQLMKESNKEVIVGVDIKDTGIGIAADRVDAIFEEFTQAHLGISRKFGGTGLGLAISRKLVRYYKGDISVESEIGVGTTFSFTLNLGRYEGESAPVKIDLSIPVAEPAPTCDQELLILVVEDNKINQIVARKQLENFGFGVVVAENGQVALDCLKEKNFDLILMDVNMPVMDGIEATRIIRTAESAYQDIKIIAMTASVLKKDISNCLDAGMDAFVSKPFDPGELKQTILQQMNMDSNS